MIARADAGRLPLRDECVDTIVTSPPYNLNMPYEGVNDLVPISVYDERVCWWAAEIARVLAPSGRCFVNVPDVAQREPRNAAAGRWSPSAMWRHWLEVWCLDYRQTIIWQQVSDDASCAWGSWLSAAGPNVRGRHEVILWFYKAPFTKERTGHNDVPKEKFLEITRSVWLMGTAARNGPHPCPYPAELVRRCLWLSTWPGDLVLDPFVGSGTTVREAERMGRRGVGFDLSEAYCREVAGRGTQSSLFDFAEGGDEEPWDDGEEEEDDDDLDPLAHITYTEDVAVSEAYL